MLPKETAVVESIRKLYGFYNQTGWDEFLREMVDKAWLENHHFTDYSTRSSQQITEYHINWSTMKAKFAEIIFEMIPECPHLKMQIIK
jgi:hypothetical protein